MSASITIKELVSIIRNLKEEEIEGLTPESVVIIQEIKEKTEGTDDIGSELQLEIAELIKDTNVMQEINLIERSIAKNIGVESEDLIHLKYALDNICPQATVEENKECVKNSLTSIIESMLINEIEDEEKREEMFADVQNTIESFLEPLVQVFMNVNKKV